MQLAQAFRIDSKEMIAFVGAGGKTSAMLRLAAELVAQGRRVITTTTTRLGVEQVTPFLGLRSPTSSTTAPSNPFVIRVPQTEDAIWEEIHIALALHPHILIIGNEVEPGKVGGVSVNCIDRLATLDDVDIVMYEADGARMLPFKAPAAHEPVVANSTTLLVPTIGITALEAPLDDAHVHRAEIAARLAGARIGEIVTPLIAARVLAHPEGGIKGKPPQARTIALINQVETISQLHSAHSLARLLLGFSSIDAVAIGAVRSEESPSALVPTAVDNATQVTSLVYPIHETDRRVAAIVLAAGAGTRMAGRIKQLLPWRAKTLVENAIALAAGSDVNETVVVLGAFAKEIRAVIGERTARVILNHEWEGGQSTSLRAGLSALSPNVDAAIFINADQPFLTSAVINQIIWRYRATDESIVAAQYAGRRGSPVLFQQRHFAELARLQGEMGGRELFGKYRPGYVEFADERLGTDVDTFEEYERLTRDTGSGIF